MSNERNTTLYTGFTNDLKRRAYEHKKGKSKSFTHKYNISKLIYYETTNSMETAIAREKQIKSGSRKKKEDLINGTNKKWRDLYYELVGIAASPQERGSSQ